MRRFWPVILLTLLAACTNGVAARQAELSQWIGRPEVDLVGLMGAPTRTYDTGNMKFLTYDDRRVEIVPGSPYFGPDPFWYGGGGGFPPTTATFECATTFTVAGGIVRAYSLRGNACG